MAKRRDLTGQRFGKLVVLGLSHIQPEGAARRAWWNTRCDCGAEKAIRGNNLTTGGATTCGCGYREAVTRHGMKGSPEYRSWQAMKQRCLYEKHKSFDHYGGRGITICPQWLASFENFYADMGPRPEGTTLDRIDPDGDYTPDNCRWASHATQTANRKRSIADHQIKCLNCGEGFVARRSNAKFCTVNCGDRYRYARRRA